MKKSIIAIIAASSMLVSAPVYATSLGLDVALDVALTQGGEEQAIQANANATIAIDSANQAFQVTAEGAGMGEEFAIQAYGQVDGSQVTIYASEDGSQWIKATEDAGQIAELFAVDLSAPLDLSSVIDVTETADGYKYYEKDFTLEELYTLAKTLGIPNVDELETMGIDQLLPMFSDILLTVSIATNEADDTFASFYITLDKSDFTTLNSLLATSEVELNYNTAVISIENLADDSAVEIPADVIEGAIEQDIELPSIG